MKMDRGLSRVVLLSLLSGVLGSLFIAVGPAHAQATISTLTIQVPGTAPTVSTAATASTVPAGAVTFAGPLVVTATVVPDPALGPGVAVFIDGRGVKGTDNKTGIVYLNECEANLTRPFTATDVIKTTFAYFEDKPGSYLNSKTGLLTLNLTYNTTTMVLTKVTASFSTP